ncbi:MAG TPA: hypothetical protein HPP87_04720 [Planctomycetes bacterium]|nr:hypothetical protein [Planctomycetota bacterium]
MAELFYKGLPPVAGGVYDQAAVFVHAARFVRAEQEYYKAKMLELEN